MLSLLLAMCCGTWPEPPARRKRLTLVLLTGLLAWIPENVLFVAATLKDVRPAESILGRPYLFEFGPVVEAVWAWIIMGTVSLSAFMWIFAITRPQRARVSHNSTTKREISRTNIIHMVFTEPGAAVFVSSLTTWATSITCFIFASLSSTDLAFHFGSTRGSAPGSLFYSTIKSFYSGLGPNIGIRDRRLSATELGFQGLEI